MDLSRHLLCDGHPVRAYGRVVATAGRTWFEPPLPVTLPGYRPVHEAPPRPPSHLAVRVAGVDLDRLALRREKDGTVEGLAVLAGTWRAGGLVVTEQESSTGPAVGLPWDHPPCPESAGGWPEGAEHENLDIPTELRATLPIVSIRLFRPSARQVVLVVATDRPEQVEEALRPLFGARLCVLASRWSRRQVEDVIAALHDRMGEWLIYRLGRSVGEDGQLRAHVRVIQVLSTLASWDAQLPDGLLSVRPWLAPAPDRQRVGFVGDGF